MQRLQNLVFGGLAMLAVSFPAFGQESQNHVFPQVADGQQSDSSFYYSLLTVTNLGSVSADCTLSSVGVPADRFRFPLTFTVLSGQTTLNYTLGEGALVSGYATLDCSQPVFGNAFYQLSTPAGQALGMATVFSAPPVTYATFPMFTGLSARYGVALANPSSSAISVTFLLTEGNGQTTGTTIQIPPFSHYARFIDEVLVLPSSVGSSILEISSGLDFHLTGLIYNGGVFATLIPAMR